MREAKVLITDEGRQALKTAHVPAKIGWTKLADYQFQNRH
jgi:hypothetical protein